MMKITMPVFCGLLFVLLLCGSVVTTSAAFEMTGSGQLTSVGPDARVFIDNKGFLVDRNTRVFDDQNKEILLYRLNPPALVKYQFSYTTRGVIISRIQVIPQ